MRIAKRILIGLGAVVLILLAASYFIILNYKKEISAQVAADLKLKYGLILNVEKVRLSLFDNWPHISLELKKISVLNSRDSLNAEPLLKAGSVALSFNIRQLILGNFVLKNISIKSAELNLIRNFDGTSNFEFSKSKLIADSTANTNETGQINFEVKSISLRNTQFKFLNRQKGQFIGLLVKKTECRLRNFEEGKTAKLVGEVFVSQLLFNPKKGAFLRNKNLLIKLDVIYLDSAKTICVAPPSKIAIDRQEYSVSSFIDLSSKKQLSLIIQARDCNLLKVKELLTPKLKQTLNNFDVTGPLTAKMLMVTQIGKTQAPILVLDIVGENTNIIIGKKKVPYTHLNFTGKLVSIDSGGTCGNMEKAKMNFKITSGEIYDFPFNAKVSIKNLKSPFINVLGEIAIDPSKIKFKIKNDFALRGLVTAKLKYSGPLRKLNNRDFLSDSMALKADVYIKELKFREAKKTNEYLLKGKLQLNKNDLFFDELQLHTGGGDVLLKGNAKSIFAYVLGFSEKVRVDIAATTNSLDLNPFFEKSVKSENVKAKRKAGISKTKVRGVESKAIFSFKVQFLAKNLKLKKIEAQNVNAQLEYQNKNLTINSIHLNTCEGYLKGKARLINFEQVAIDVEADKIDVQKIFLACENFGQSAIEAKNLKGKLFFKAKFQSSLDPQMEIMPQSMVGDVKLKLSDGHILNYEPVQKLSNALFKNRDFDDVSFSELNETFRLKGYVMEIDELEIASNVLNLFVLDGIYNFKGLSNINVLVPWNNLKKRNKDYVPVSSGESAQNAKGVKLNFYGPNDKMRLSFGQKPMR